MLKLAEFEIPSQPGKEIQAIENVAGAIQPLELAQDQIERLKTAVGECTMNAMEHGNHFQANIPVKIRVLKSNNDLLIQVIDEGAALRCLKQTFQIWMRNWPVYNRRAAGVYF